ncbi:protein kinase, partial [Myxococcota bacterium]|nr:protein kinase [Myxococcota bacterium]
MEDLPLLENDRFHLLRKLGGGGMGIVYEAEDKLLGTRVALKTLKDANMESLIFLKKEFRSLQDMQHANLISFGELFENKGQWFFTMELINGVDFFTHIRTEPCIPHSTGEQSLGETVTAPDPEAPLFERLESTKDGHKKLEKKRFPAYDEERLRGCLVQLVNGLMALHGADMLHRDIKPGNIMVDKKGRVVLLDFGLVTESAQNQEEVSSLFPVGTAGYMSPEQAASQPLTYASDWYSVGVVLYHALTGHLPFEGSFSSIIFQKQGREAPLASDYILGVSEDLDHLCRDLLNFDPQKRPSGKEILSRLRGAPLVQAVSLEKSLSQSHLFTGRKIEMARLVQFYEEYVSGKNEAVLIHGASGLGKSELVRNFLQNHVRGQEKTIVFTGRCYETESVSFKAFDPIIDGLSQFLCHVPLSELQPLLPPNAHHLIRVFPVLSRVKALEDKSETVDTISYLPEFRAGAFGALRELLTRLTSRFNLVIHIDNFQWADEDSLKLLRTLMLPPDPPHCFFIVAQRTNANPKIAKKEVQQSLACVPVHTRGLEVGPLSPAETEALARKVLTLDLQSAEPSAEALSMLSSESGGHPLFVHELARFISARGTSAAQGNTLSLDDVLWERVESLEPQPRDIVQIASLCAVPVSADILSTIMNIPPGKCIRHINQLRVATLIAARGSTTDRRVEPFHDRVREAVVQRLDPATAQKWHQTLAQAYKESREGSPDILAYHYRAAGEYHRARIHYIKAAKIATASLAFERATQLLSKALELWPESDLATDTKKRAVVRDLARNLANAGRGRQAAHKYLELVPGALAAEQLELQRLAGGILMRSGHVTEGLAVMEKVL